MNKGFINLIAAGIIGIGLTIAGLIFGINYLTLGDLNKLNFNKPLGATSITDITSATLISDLATVLPANFNSLNSNKIEVASSSIAAITTLSNLTTVGALASGSLTTGFTAVNVAQGGTGSTTLSKYHVLTGSSTSAIGIVDGVGTDGQVLTSQGASLPPVWETYAVDQAGTYSWTSQHTFSSVYMTLASSTNSTTTGSLYADRMGIGTATSSSGNLRVSKYLQVDGTSSTTDLVISGTCTGCSGAMTTSTTAVLNTDADASTGASVSCVSPKVVAGGGLSFAGGYQVIASYPSANDTWAATVVCKAAALGTCSAGNLTVYARCIKP